MAIRICTKEDVNDVYELICEMKGERHDFEKFKTAYEALYEEQRYTFFLYELEGNVVGFLSIIIDYILYRADKVAVIEELMVSEKARGKGIGKALLEYATNYAKEKRCVLLELSSGFSREFAHQFYERQGFEKAGYHFRKRLSE